MTTLSHQSRVSPESVTKNGLLPLSSQPLTTVESSNAPSAATTTTTHEASPAATTTTPKASNHKSSRFRRRKRSGGGTAPTYRRSASSMSLEDESSSSLYSERGTTTTSVVKLKKKKSLLYRLLSGGKTSSKKSLVIETTTNTTPATATPMSGAEDSDETTDPSTTGAGAASPTTTDSPTKKKSGSLRFKIMSKSSYHKATAAESSNKAEEVLTTLSDEPTQALDYEEEDFTEIDMLEEQGQQLRLMGQTNEALKAWDEALGLFNSPPRDVEEDAQPAAVSSSSSSLPICKSNQIKCRMIDLHVRLAQEEQQKRDDQQEEQQQPPQDGGSSSTTSTDHYHLQQANNLIGQLGPLQINDNSAGCLQPSPLLMELLTKNSCWGYALQVSHQMMLLDQPVEPLMLARLHLEVALQQQQQQQQRSSSLGGGSSDNHLRECHQLLLSVSNNNSIDDEATATAATASSSSSNATRTTLDTLWQELAQAYASIGEEELAVGCSQSRMQRLLTTNPQQVALAHYDYALNVYSPAQQYGLALKEAELALSALSLWKTKTTDNTVNMSGDVVEVLQEGSSCSAAAASEAVEEEEDAELLLIKLYQFKADVLCRMGRIPESIQSYEQLLDAYLESKTPHYGPVDAANVLYILGKLSVRIKNFKAALQYFDRELQMTQSVVGEGSPHLAISKIHHEQAKVADAGLMDYPLAVQYYEKALRVEMNVYQQAKKDQQQKQSSSSSVTTMRCQQQQQQQKPISGSSLAVPSSTSSLLQDAKYQVSETKQCLGKLHFKMGDFATAVRTTLAVDK